MAFFVPGQKSNCIFHVAESCDLFHYSAPAAIPEFFDVVPFTMAVFLADGSHPPEVLDRIYQTIAGVWQDRKVGFACERIPYSEISTHKPCEACRAARRAQAVVI